MNFKGWEDVLKMIFVETLHTSALSSCSLSVSAVSPSVPPHEQTVPAMHGMTPSTPNTLWPSFPLSHSLGPSCPPCLFNPLPSGLYLAKIPPFSHFFRSIRLLVDTDVGCLLELSYRKFPESLEAQNWKRHNRKVERELWFLPFFRGIKHGNKVHFYIVLGGCK